MPFQIHLCLRALQTSTRRVLNRVTVIAVISVSVRRLLIIFLFVGTFCKTRELLLISILLLHRHLAVKSQLDSVRFSTINSSFQQFMSHLKKTFSCSGKRFDRIFTVITLGIMKKKLYHGVGMLEEDTERGINWMEQNKLLEIHRFSLLSYAY